jgi:eukaryotic-like serine/threonine-protein kinase
MTNTGAPQEVIIGGRYRVIRELGRGGMGSVYEAENLRTRRRVALKTMRPEVSERADFAQRFEREAQAGGQLRHPNIIDVLDMGDDPTYGLVYIVQEFLHGGDLGKCLKSIGFLPPHAALATLLPIMDALGTAHAHGIVHRDIKPDNIFLHETPQGVIPKLIDFGIAKFEHTEDEQSCTATGQMIGSPSYMSPEQARGDGDLDARTDVWSLGVVFYKCLSGSIAYTAPTTNALLAKIIYEEPSPLALLAPHLPADLVAVIQQAVVKNRDQRWPSMRAFADALRSCALWQGVDAARAQRWVLNVRGETLEMPPVLSTSVPPNPVPLVPDSSSRVSSGQRSGQWGGEVPSQSISWTRTSRSPYWLAGVFGVLTLAILATAVFLWPRQPPTPEPIASVQAVVPLLGISARPTPAGHPIDSGVVAPVATQAATPVFQAVAIETPVIPPRTQAPEIRVDAARVPNRRHPIARHAPPATGIHSTTEAATIAPRRGSNGALIMR